MEQLELYVPKLEDLWFYQKMMSDPETMSYNANWDVNYDGYHRDTGCVDYPDAVLPAWYENMVGQEPERFYAYIKRSADGAWIGDVNFHYNPAKDWWDMGIVLYAPYRRKGYAVPALKLMLEHAFRDCGISRIHNDFEVARNEARPFIVQSGKQRVEVLGTSFDVTAYEGEPGIYTTLLQGSVEVSGEKGKQLLKPGQQAIYTEKGIEVKEVNAALYCSWIQDRFVFVSEELEAVTRKLERWYDVSFFFAGESLKIKRFSGSIPKYSDLSKVLKMLELTTNIRFKKTDKTVVVEMIQ